MNILADYLQASASRVGLQPAIETLDSSSITSISYASLQQRVCAMACALRGKYGLQTGDRVAIAMSNHSAYMEILFAAWYAGLCVAPMNPRLHAREFAALATDSEARLCIATAEIAGPLSELLSHDVPMVVVDSSEHQSLYAAGQLNEPVDVDSDSTAWMFYTSGTTGRPKGAMLTHKNLDAMVKSFIIDSGAATDETLLHLAPLSHAGGLIGLAYVMRGLPQFVPPPGGLTPAILSGCLKAAGKSSLFAVPTLVNRFMDSNFLEPSLHQHIHTIMFGGAPMYVADLRKAIACFGAKRLWGAYGQGEAPCTITHIPSSELANTTREDYEELLGSVGVARSGVEVRVVDEKDNQVENDVIGEVVVRGDVVMAGYWNLPEATAATLHDGWLHTGDLGRIGKTGILTLVDRSKDMIISGGSNIYPREIEEVLLLHPAVVEVAVIGEEHPEWGEVPVAFVVTREALVEHELDDLCLQNIARYKRPRDYRFVDELPKSSYGKILKTSLRTEPLSG